MPGGVWMAWTQKWTASIGWPLMFFALLLFPDGRLPSPGWRPFAWFTAAVFAGLAVLAAFEPGRLSNVPVANPTGIERAGSIIDSSMSILVFVVLGIVLATAASVVVRFRRALYEIDLLINRTLVYGALTAALVAVCLGGVATIQAAFRALTGQEQQPQLAAVVSTLAIAALFNPLRRRIQSFIDRRFYRSKYDAAKTLQGFSTKLRDETDLEALRGDLVGVVKDTMQPAHVSLWLRPDTASQRQQPG